MFGNNYPYTDFHELNLDWIIKKVCELEKNFDDKSEEFIREKLNKIFIESMVDEENETLIIKVKNEVV